jgi:hypothetical protein
MVLSTTGPHDLLMEVTCTGKADLADLIGRRLRQIPGVRGTEAYQYLEVHKLPFAWRGADIAMTWLRNGGHLDRVRTVPGLRREDPPDHLHHD